MMTVACFLVLNYGPSDFQGIVDKGLHECSIRIIEWTMNCVVEEGSEYQGTDLKNSTSDHVR